MVNYKGALCDNVGVTPSVLNIGVSEGSVMAPSLYLVWVRAMAAQSAEQQISNDEYGKYCDDANQ